MKKAILLVLTLLVSVMSVSAWHCTDNQDGSIEGWHRINEAGPNRPAGCEATSYWTSECEDYCMEDNTFRDFVCEDRFPGTQSTEQVIGWEDLPEDSRCTGTGTQEVPEFTTIGAGIALALAGVVIYRKRR